MSEITTILLTDISQKLRPTPVTVDVQTAGITIVLKNSGDVLNLHYQDGKLILEQYDDGINQGLAPTILYSKSTLVCPVCKSTDVNPNIVHPDYQAQVMPWRCSHCGTYFSDR